MKNDYQFHINGLKGIKPYLQSLMLTTNYEGMGEIDAKEIGETIDLAIEALEKQIPQRVNYEFDGYYDGVPVYDIAECPCCGYKFYEGEHDWEMGVCPKCHQALDWSDAE